MKFSSPKKLNKTPLGEARCFSSIQFFNSTPPPLSKIQSVRTPLVPYHSLCSTCACVTYRTMPLVTKYFPLSPTKGSGGFP